MWTIPIKQQSCFVFLKRKRTEKKKKKFTEYKSEVPYYTVFFFLNKFHTGVRGPTTLYLKCIAPNQWWTWNKKILLSAFGFFQLSDLSLILTSCPALCTADCVHPSCLCTDLSLFLTPGFFLKPDCTSAVPNTACCLLTTFACLTLDFRLSPTCTFARIFWLIKFFSLRPVPGMYCLCFFLTVNKYPNYHSLESASGSTVFSGLTGTDNHKGL